LGQQLEIDQIRGTEVSRYLGHSSTDVTRRYARQTPDALGRRAAEALERAGLMAIG
jgi:integrase